VKIMKNGPRAPKIFRSAANFRLRRNVRKGLKQSPWVTLTADPASCGPGQELRDGGARRADLHGPTAKG
jgi:hypothetical protein